MSARSVISRQIWPGGTPRSRHAPSTISTRSGCSTSCEDALKATHGDPGACEQPRRESARRCQHGPVDLGHEAAVLGNADEGLGRDQPHDRVAQAGERLGADDGSTARRDDGLEAGFDGVTGDRPHERALGLDAPDGTLVEARIEQRRAVASASLGGVEGGVRVPQQRLGAGIAVARDGNSRADGETQLATLDRERPAEHGAQLVGDLHAPPLRPPPRRRRSRTRRCRRARRCRRDAGAPARRRATAISTRSPSRWPSVSFTSLKRSRSTMQAAIRRFVRRARPIDVRSPSSRSVRLGSEVRPSCSA